MSNTQTQIFAQNSDKSSIKLTPTQNQKTPKEPQTSISNSQNSSKSDEFSSLETFVPESYRQNNVLSQSELENLFSLPEITKVKDSDIRERTETTGRVRKILLELGLITYPLDSSKIVWFDKSTRRSKILIAELEKLVSEKQLEYWRLR